MIGIEQIAGFLPDARLSNLDRLDEFGISEDFITSKIGVEGVLRKDPREDASDLCVRAFKALRRASDVTADDIDCLIVCTQNPDGQGLPHTSAIVHGKLGCKDGVAAFDVSLGCSGWVYCLSMAIPFMERCGLRRGLLFTADPYSKIIDPQDKNTSLLFSDASAVTLLTDRPVFKLGATAFATQGVEHENLICRDGRLEMNGRAIFNFSMTKVPQQIRDVAANGGHSLDDIDLFVFHQASKYLLDMMTRRLKLDPAKVPTNLKQVGNTVSSSIPLLLQDYMSRTDIRKVLVSGFGVGLSWATATLERE